MKVKIKKKLKGYFVGEVVDIPNNDAHTLVDKGYATVYTEKYSNKMMRTK